MRRFLTVLFFVPTVALAILLRAPLAHAEEPASWRFVYDARVEGCPARAQVRGQVVARLGFDPFREEANASNELWIAIRADGGGLVAAVERREDGTIVGERALRASSDCGELAASAALAGSILVDPTGSMAKRQPPRSEPAPLATATRAENPWSDEKQPVPPTAPRPSVEVSVAGRIVGSLGLAPSPSLGFSIDGAIRRQHLEFRIEGRGDLPVSADRLPDGAGVATTLLIGSLVPCWTDRWLHLCGVFSAGGMFAKSEGLDPVERDATFFGAVGLRPMAAVSVYGPLKVIATVEGLLPLRQLSLTVRQKEVWSSPVVAGAAGIGLEARFL